MLDPKSALAGAATVILGAVIGGAGFIYFTDTPSSAQTPDMRMAQSQIEPQPSQAERDFMDFTMPDLSKPKAGQDVTRHGCVKPNRPQWVTDLPRAEAEKSLLLTALYDAARFQAVIENNSCPCETEYPSWDEADWQYQKIANGKNNAEITELKRQATRQASNFRFDALTICSQSRGN
ncbi:MAG: hypothetical protein FJX25_00640 [Alphaproteobacteria bacterium]|nr:hypothetical protein [Alphaproteobacteria bacterium]